LPGSRKLSLVQIGRNEKSGRPERTIFIIIKMVDLLRVPALASCDVGNLLCLELLVRLAGSGTYAFTILSCAGMAV